MNIDTNQQLNEQQSELKKLIIDSFEKQEKKIDDIDEKIDDINVELAKIKVDTTWIKWLFGGLLSFILILMSVIITLLFRLVV